MLEREWMPGVIRASEVLRETCHSKIKSQKKGAG